MKKIILISFFLLAVSFSPPRKIFYPYAISITESELIVDGAISKVNSSEYEFEVCEFIKGNSSEKINIKIWGEWTCDTRVGKIEKGQRLLLFLKKSYGNCYHAFNESTGELFVSDDGSVKTTMTKSLPKVEELKNGIRMFHKAFRFNGDLTKYFEKNRNFERLVSQEKINQMKAENKFFEFIVNEELKRYEIK